MTEPEWSYIVCGHRSLICTVWRRAKLWSRIVAREWHAGRIGPAMAWQVCATVHPWREPVKRWGVVDEGRTE